MIQACLGSLTQLSKSTNIPQLKLKYITGCAQTRMKASKPRDYVDIKSFSAFAYYLYIQFISARLFAGMVE